MVKIDIPTHTMAEMIDECKANIDILESFNEKERNIL